MWMLHVMTTVTMVVVLTAPLLRATGRFVLSLVRPYQLAPIGFIMTLAPLCLSVVSRDTTA